MDSHRICKQFWDSLVCMCVLSGSDWVFLRKRTAFSFSSFRMSRPRLDWIWAGTASLVTPPGLTEGGGGWGGGTCERGAQTFSSSCSCSVLASSVRSSNSSSSSSLFFFHSISARVATESSWLGAGRPRRETLSTGSPRHRQLRQLAPKEKAKCANGHTAA